MSGGHISNFFSNNSCTKKLEDIDNLDYLLDNVTGDLYNYHYESNELTSKANIGLHNEKAAKVKFIKKI